MLEHGTPVRLNPRVQRLVAPNPGVMTGPGTNTYLLGTAAVAVVDPGPALPAHIDAILEAAGERIRWVVCTHTHPDHSPAWRAIAEATGAEVIGALPADDLFQDDTFAPNREVVHDDVLVTDEFTLRAVHTPGHVSNHFCFLLEQEHMLFAGDHIMNGSTVVIVPPGGDMQAYIKSLELLLRYPLQVIAPGHGELLSEPRAAIEWLIDHRLMRERKVIAALRQSGAASLDKLVEVVYDDVDSSLHQMARLSLSAHLIKLQRESRARHRDADDAWEMLD